MVKLRLLIAAIMLALAFNLVPAPGVSAVVDPGTQINVALGKPVTLTGSFFTDGWGHGLIVSPGTITDGAFLPGWGTQWDQGAVWWDSHNSRGQYITIDLQGLYMIYEIVVEADGNDAYDVYYDNGSGEGWRLAWELPGYAGMPPYQRSHMLDAPILASRLMITGNDALSDLYYCLSEVQALGYANGTFVGGYGSVIGNDGRSVYTLMGVFLGYAGQNMGYLRITGPDVTWMCWNEYTRIQFGEFWVNFTGWFNGSDGSRVLLGGHILLENNPLTHRDSMWLYNAHTWGFMVGLAWDWESFAPISGNFIKSNLALYLL